MPRAIVRVLHGYFDVAYGWWLAMDFTHLKKSINVSDGNLSTHMRQLEEAGYLLVTKQFKGKRPQTLCTLTESGRAAFTAYLVHLESMLPPKF